jgi:GNAT superfamily N-acetyltransferase
MTLRLRVADLDDAEHVALLHADSWRRYYRGAYSDSYLDGDIVTDRLAVWSERLAAPAATRTVVAEDDTGLVGFVHVVFDDDARWGSLIDNLHVTRGHQRTGIGTELIACAAEGVVERATGRSVYLWVQEQNLTAQQFYQATGGSRVERAPISPPGGVPSRLVGRPHKLRFTWPDASVLAGATRR